jgi:hypothetical protein
MILRSAGFIHADLFSSQNAVNFAYILYLRGRAEKLGASEIERLVRRWFVMSTLTQRYSGNPETSFDLDIRQIEKRGLSKYVDLTVDAELSSSYWSTLLPQEMETSSANSPSFRVFQAAQVKLGDKGFLSRDITVQDLILNASDVHHVFPKGYLKKERGLSRSQYNQIANFVLAQSEINIAIGNKPPAVYFPQLLDQCSGGKKRYGGITDGDQLDENMQQHCIPKEVFGNLGEDYQEFLEERRRLMAKRIKKYFATL